jgi:septal ring factor EnvC (AmiA/AmiB activator)
MAKSREEVLADLRSVFGNKESSVATKSPPAAAPSPQAGGGGTQYLPSKTAIFAKFKKVEDEAADQDETEEEVEDEDTEESDAESDTSPLNETLDEIQKMIAVVDLDLTRLNDSIDALRDHVAACR